jgi:hypothetical protein
VKYDRWVIQCPKSAADGSFSAKSFSSLLLISFLSSYYADKLSFSLSSLFQRKRRIREEKVGAMPHAAEIRKATAKLRHLAENKRAATARARELKLKADRISCRA